jgi:hypothetical protein
MSCLRPAHGAEADVTMSTGVTRASLNYVSSTTVPSLLGSGEVFTRRDVHELDVERRGIVRQAWQVPVVDARRIGNARWPTVWSSGFELLDCPLSSHDLDFMDHERVVRRYYPECEEVVRKATGAVHVVAFDHNVRYASGHAGGHRTTGGRIVQSPAQAVHNDFTLTSAPRRVREAALPPGINDTVRGLLAPGRTLLTDEWVDRALREDGRFAIVNVWRNIAAAPLERHPLALCDARSVTLGDLVACDIRYQDRIGQNYLSRHSPDHAWFCYPDMLRDEVLLIKQWDSAGTFAASRGTKSDASDVTRPGTFSLHTAFDDPGTRSGAGERRSAEVRCLAIFAPGTDV